MNRPIDFTSPVVFQRMSDGELHGLVRSKTIASGRTAVQFYEIVEFSDFGRALLLDGCIQSTEHDEELYHESLVFPAGVHVPEVRSVLCLGGANGGLLKQVLKCPMLERVLVVDVDRELHELSRVHLPHMHGETLEDRRVTITFDDPGTVIRTLCETADHHRSFDLIIADLPDATEGSYASNLFTREFYIEVQLLLGDGGAYVTQAGQAHFRHCGFLNRVLRTLSSAFAHTVPYTVVVPSLGTPWAFVVASKRRATPDEIERRIASLPLESLVSYDADSHAHMFKLPKVLRIALARNEPIITTTDVANVSVAHRSPVT
jgi:spermidine synthase